MISTVLEISKTVLISASALRTRPNSLVLLLILVTGRCYYLVLKTSCIFYSNLYRGMDYFIMLPRA